MKRLPTGVIVVDVLDIVCISISLGSTLAYLNRRRRERKKIDPIVAELTRECPLVIPVYIDGTPMKTIKPPMMRGGTDIVLRSVTIKSKKLTELVFKIIGLKKKYKQIKLLQLFFATLNSSLTINYGLRVALGGSLNYVDLIIITFPSTVAGYLMEQAISNPLVTILGPLIVIFGRGIEDIEDDPLEKCRLLCKFAEQYHNRELMIEMEILNSALEDASTAIQLPLEKVPLPLVCVEEKLSLLERFKLRQLIQSGKAKKRVQYFSEFIKNFPECDADPEAIYEKIVE